MPINEFTRNFNFVAIAAVGVDHLLADLVLCRGSWVNMEELLFDTLEVAIELVFALIDLIISIVKVLIEASLWLRDIFVTT